MPGFNFRIQSHGPISEKFLEKGIHDFAGAASFVKQLPYKRNKDKASLLKVFEENCGTCGTKHGLLKQLAIENEIPKVKLVIGFYKMNNKNTPGIGDTLSMAGINYLPEAHNYLRINNQIFDYTFAKSAGIKFENDLLHEVEIEPSQIGEFKIKLHKDFLESWLNENKEIQFSLPELWSIREACIQKLSENKINV